MWLPSARRLTLSSSAPQAVAQQLSPYCLPQLPLSARVNGTRRGGRVARARLVLGC